MPKNPLRPINCLHAGCGYTYKHKRMGSKAFKQEHFQHRASGECAKRVLAFNERDLASREGDPGVTRSEVTLMMAPVYELIRNLHEEIGDVRKRLARRLESRKSAAEYNERASLPPPWILGDCVEHLRGCDVDVGKEFKSMMPKEWTSWENALTQWFHFILGQCSSDPVLLMAKDVVRFHTAAGPENKTKLQFFRCFKNNLKDWDPVDEAGDAFFVGFWYPLVRHVKRHVIWGSWINFELSKRGKREALHIWHDEMMDPREELEWEPRLKQDNRTARVFYDVLVERRRLRRDARMADEKAEE